MKPYFHNFRSDPLSGMSRCQNCGLVRPTSGAACAKAKPCIKNMEWKPRASTTVGKPKLPTNKR
jgi:hypothetical protein